MVFLAKYPMMHMKYRKWECSEGSSTFLVVILGNSCTNLPAGPSPDRCTSTRRTSYPDSLLQLTRHCRANQMGMQGHRALGHSLEKKGMCRS